MQLPSKREIDDFIQSRATTIFPLLAWAGSFVAGAMTSLFVLMLLRSDIPPWLGFASLAVGAASNVIAIYAMLRWHSSRERIRGAAGG